MPVAHHFCRDRKRNDGAAFGAGHQKRRMGIACERAGIERITFHGQRHTYASQLAMAGVPQAYIRDALGHRTLAMSDRYMPLRAVALCRNDPQCRAIVQPHEVERYRD
jgi:integrase